MRLRLSLVAALSSLAIGLTAVPAAVASPPRSPSHVTTPAALDTIHVAGVTKNGRRFVGTYAIDGFVVRGSTVYAVGTLRGTLKGRHINRAGVLMPASLTGDTTTTTPSTTTTPGGTTIPGAARDAAASCPILHLLLGPINVNLLGLRVTIGGGTAGKLPIVVNITAVPGAGNLLGNLLCDLTNALNGTGVLGQLSSQLQQLQATLTSLLSIVGQL